MHIAINAHLLAHTRSFRRAGVSNYTEALLTQLGAIDQQNRYTIYTTRGLDGAALGLPPNFAVRPSRLPTINPRVRIPWEQLLGPALLGIFIHFPAYRLGGFLSIRFSKNEEDVISTAKIISAMLFFPLTWLIVSLVVLELGGWLMMLGALFLMPVTGYLAMRFLEESDKFLGGLRALAFFLVRRRFFVRLLAERRAIRAEILALGEEAGATELRLSPWRTVYFGARDAAAAARAVDAAGERRRVRGGL
jgi:hypothetical protein